MSSLLVQVTVVPTGTVSVSGPKTKLSIFTAAAAADGSAFAVTLEAAANSIIAITAGNATLARHLFFFVMIVFLSNVFSSLLVLRPQPYLRQVNWQTASRSPQGFGRSPCS